MDRGLSRSWTDSWMGSCGWFGYSATRHLRCFDLLRSGNLKIGFASAECGDRSDVASFAVAKFNQALCLSCPARSFSLDYPNNSKS